MAVLELLVIRGLATIVGLLPLLTVPLATEIGGLPEIEVDVLLLDGVEPSKALGAATGEPETGSLALGLLPNPADTGEVEPPAPPPPPPPEESAGGCALGRGVVGSARFTELSGSVELDAVGSAAGGTVGDE